ncbi:hypothetical protein C1645_821862 [Glomus cerebriforme]|uniref:Uncharacterized protein n=1 Tax=Glomus cerebriforme TaxID=658196 RepID=A0A397SZA7_9GLOM|nr:hypothetical protein C1645_821862 [Glomus cerebriforme]
MTHNIAVLGDENIYRYDVLEDEDRNVDYQEKEYNDSKYEKEEEEEEERFAQGHNRILSVELHLELDQAICDDPNPSELSNQF